MKRTIGTVTLVLAFCLALLPVSAWALDTGCVSGGSWEGDRAGGYILSGQAELTRDLLLGEGETLTLAEGAAFTIPENTRLTIQGTLNIRGTLTVNGTLDNQGAIHNSGTLTGTITGSQPPKITTETLPGGTTGVLYEQTLKADGDGTITWALAPGSTLPEGWNLTPEGKLTGTPAEAGNLIFGVVASSQYGSGVRQFSLEVQEASYTISVNTGKVNFDLCKEGYTAPAAQTLTVTNTGNQPVTVPLPTAENYLIGAGEGFTEGTALLEPGDTANFTVQPKTGLMAGDYTETIQIKGGAGTSLTAAFQVDHDLAYQEQINPTCTQAGQKACYRCTVCGKAFGNEAGVDVLGEGDTVLPANGHTWGQPTWTWSADGRSCTAAFTCAADSSHTTSLQATITSAVKTAATCQRMGVTTYTATVELDGQKYTSTKEVTDIPLANHLAKWEGDYPATCDRNGREGTATCLVCGKVLVEDKVIPAPGHKYGDPVWTWSKDGKSCTVAFTCSVCGFVSESQATVTTETVVKPTCTKAGTGTRRATVTFNGNPYTSTQGTVTLAALDHTYKNGKCTVCGQTDPDAKPAATASVTAGANASWTTGTAQGLAFTYQGEGKLAKVQVNGATLAEEEYTLSGTTVTLTPEYLDTLDPGTYTLVISLEEASAKTTFTVTAAATPAPEATPGTTPGTTGPEATQPPQEQEGSGGNPLLWVALGAGAVLLIGGLVLLKVRGSRYE